MFLSFDPPPPPPPPLSDPALQGLSDRLGTSEHSSDYSELEHAGRGLVQGLVPGLGPGHGSELSLKRVISLDDISKMAKNHQQTPPGSEPSSFLVLSSGAR